MWISKSGSNTAEMQVNENTPPIFLWQTVTDEIVPVENSILMAQALKKYKVPFELHLFERGKHGLSLANEEGAYHGMKYGTYTLEQIFRTGMEVERGTVSIEKAKKEEIISYQTIKENKRENMNRYYCWKSENLCDWSEPWICFQSTESCFGNSCFWAPEVYEFEGKFYKYYTARWKIYEEEQLRIGISE